MFFTETLLKEEICGKESLGKERVLCMMTLVCSRKQGINTVVLAQLQLCLLFLKKTKNQGLGKVHKKTPLNTVLLMVLS